LIDVEENYKSFHHPELLLLRDKLDTLLQRTRAERPLTTNSEAYLWGPQEADTAAELGLNFSNPATTSSKGYASKLVRSSTQLLEFL